MTKQPLHWVLFLSLTGAFVLGLVLSLGASSEASHGNIRRGAVDWDQGKIEWRMRNITASEDVTVVALIAAPSGLTATALSNSEIQLEWNAVSGALGYYVYRGVVKIASTQGTRYIDTGLTANTAYTYQVSAYDAAGEGTKSTAAGATTTWYAIDNPHAFYTTTTAKCANCHRYHTAGGSNLLLSASPQSQLCFTCHDGTGANANVSVEWSDPSVPANDSGTSAFYSHPATTASSHTNASQDEFQGVLNRHSECSDCHSAHALDTTAGSASANGWTASGALKGVSGVGVTNGGAGTTPTFTWKQSITYEYELCFKCHSSYTNLRSYTTPSYKKEDKAREFNPNNYSYHPIEAQGKNQTARMAANLSGTSPYKVWNLTTTDVIRCTSCHANYQNNTNFSPHTSKYMGILRYNYRDRVLRTSAEAYNPADFALCFTCHTDGPFTDTSEDPRSDTNYRFHGFHVNKVLDGGSASTDINVPGAGEGRAICAECHWRVHGNTGTVAANSKRLVNFAPNVQPSATYDATSSYGPKFILITEGNPDTGACLLRCHGKDHKTDNGTNNYRYDY